MSRPVTAFVAVGAIWLIDIVWSWCAGIRLAHLGGFLLAAAVLAGNLLLYRRLRHGERAAALAEGFIVMFAIASGGTALSYLAATLNAPLADARLAAADAALGFHWLAYDRFVETHPLIRAALQFAYDSMPVQITACLVLLPLTGRIARNREFVATMGAALLVTIALFAMLPAASAWVHHGIRPAADVSFLQQLTAVRDGNMTILRLDQLDGLVTFPSFHLATAALIAYAARGTPLAMLAVLLNTAMAAATPVMGGHYLVDGIGGVAVALLAIAAVRLAWQRPDATATPSAPLAASNHGS